MFAVIINKIQTNLGIQDYYLNYKEQTKQVTINYFTRASTEYEQQKEILSIYKLFNFETSIVENIKTCTFIQTEPNTEFVKSSPLILVSKGKYIDAKALSNNEFDELELWKTLKFNQPFMIGNIHFTDRKVNFPYMNF